jgi:AcrR family transcriptional regulator
MNRNKHQVRTEITMARILDAAQAIFSEQGFENTQLEEVATRAGYTRGAIYAHFANKEELFLELMEQRVHGKFVAVMKAIEEEPEVGKRPALFRKWVAAQVGDPSWGTLTLEFKLYAVRRPEMRDKLLKMYEKLFEPPGKHFIELLFGKGLSKAKHASLERQLGLFGGAVGGVILESHFRPAILPNQHLREFVEELFDAIVPWKKES